jgi:hypothetical protein
LLFKIVFDQNDYHVERDGFRDGEVIVRQLPLRREGQERFGEFVAAGRLVEANRVEENPILKKSFF